MCVCVCMYVYEVCTNIHVYAHTGRYVDFHAHMGRYEKAYLVRAPMNSKPLQIFIYAHTGKYVDFYAVVVMYEQGFYLVRAHDEFEAVSVIKLFRDILSKLHTSKRKCQCICWHILNCVWFYVALRS